MSFFAWPEIGNFHTLRKYIKSAPELLGEQGSKVTYRCKIKLHGTNAAVQVCADGTVKAQSRTSIIDIKSDNCGFARWVASQEKEWQATKDDGGADLIFFGEWCGPGIQKGVAISNISKKVFAVFAVVIRKNEEIQIVVEPKDIFLMLFAKSTILKTNELTDVFVLPWYRETESLLDFESVVDWEASAEDLQPELTKINAVVETVEKCDPWVKQNFGVDGVGEGLVFYPSRSGHTNFANLVFKAKGEQHKVVNTKAPAQADAEVVNSAKEFANLVLTEARLDQGARAVGGDNPTYDMKVIGKFLDWVSKDVKKETAAELEASKLTWEQVSKVVTTQARQWYLAKSKAL